MPYEPARTTLAAPRSRDMTIVAIGLVCVLVVSDLLGARYSRR
jgi:hypothetical protein